ncbi:MAG TPA: DUF427 domain-containing protein [Stellaceae bacterium]|nr:DUF427 domain-containing protein [Stellaceae bacterium]
MSATPAPGFAADPDYRIVFEPSPRRVRVVFNGETIADSVAAHLLFETRHLPVYYFPRADVRFDLLRATDQRSYCPYKGAAAYWSIAVGEKISENAVWGYPEPLAEVGAIRDYVAFYWNRVDHWYEEDDEVFVHARDPYKRVDVVNSSRPVEVVVGGATVARTTRARFLYETRLPTRYYIRPEDVRMELLAPSDKTSACPYKGTARYWSVRIGDRVFPDIVWSYPEPIPECPKIKGYLCFFNEQVDEIRLDGVALPRPVTPWSKDWPDQAAAVPDQRGPVARP